MESFPFFFKVRAITFTCIMLLSLLWLVLLCVESYARWTVSDQINHSLLILLILINTFTLIMLPILILVEFRAWLDGARLLLLFVLQGGSAAAGTYWCPRTQCLNQTPNGITLCQLIAEYTMIACWIIPGILFFYSIYFAMVVYLQSRVPIVVETKMNSRADPEMGTAGSLSLWQEKLREVVGEHGPSSSTSSPPRPLMLPSMAHARLTLPSPSSPTSQYQSALPKTPWGQSTVPSPQHADEHSVRVLSSVPSRRQSLPAFRHGHTPLFHLPTPHTLASSSSSSQPQTPSSYTYSTSSPATPSFRFGPGVVEAQFPKDYRGGARHLSLMPSSSSPREMDSAAESPTTPRSSRSRLSKPVPVHLM